METVAAWTETVSIPTYRPLPPDRNPMFLQRRVYQGSSGKVYPLPFYDRISEERTPHEWSAVRIENEFLSVMILPELGGRIHAARDKSNGYDFIYRQPSIKPALVGLAGPWISGGIEFNWPQHHRPATFMPCDAVIEEHTSGAKTVWLGDHEPMGRMKSMHGVCLHPDRSFIELKVRLFNRTPFTQTFLWWANVGVRVHEKYQSFFPPDVQYVADHAKRAVSRFPLCDGRYYGIDYGSRKKHEKPRQFVPPDRLYKPNDLSWYANIPVPTSYMCLGSTGDFFGGYDHAAEAGIVHVADHHISPGKKQWTWGNSEFGYAWDRNLTDPDADGVCHPYIELMAGVFTDNQPDFSFLAPGETRIFSQFWYPIQKIGPAQAANRDVAVSLSVRAGEARLGVAATSRFEKATIQLFSRDRPIAQWTADLEPATPFLMQTPAAAELSVVVQDKTGHELIRYAAIKPEEDSAPPAASEPLPPAHIAGSDELFLGGLHLEQYRHATRMPEEYWGEALRRDPKDCRCNNAMGLWHLRRGEFAESAPFFRRAIERLTARNPNPRDGEAYYSLGLSLRFIGRNDEAADAFQKSAWNHAWQSAAFYAVAELDCLRKDWPGALCDIDRSLATNSDDLRARDLKAIILRKLGREAEAADLLAQTLRLDPLDQWAAYLSGRAITADTQVWLDIALDLARAGLFAEAIELLGKATARPGSGTAPLIQYYLGYFYDRLGQSSTASAHYAAAAKAEPDYCFPARLEEIAILQAAMQANPSDSRAPYYLGNLYYDRRRHREAITLWERSALLGAKFATVWRNLGIGYFNVLNRPRQARRAYDKAVAADPADARLVYERDQLRKRLGDPPRRRLKDLESRRELVARRDDLSIELCTLYNQLGEHDKALELLSTRRFQPWEGGEGLALEQHVRTHRALGRIALASGQAQAARAYFNSALSSPDNLGEARHPLANQSDIHYWLGIAYAACGERKKAKAHWTIAAEFTGDFQEMSVRAFSEMTYFSALSLQCLGRRAAARKLLIELGKHARKLLKTRAKIDYFATSLPTMLLFEDDLQRRQDICATFMLAQSELGLGRKRQAERLLKKVLRRNPNHPLAAELMD
jgi:tetratricopeptide (TPR) repeat protein